METNWVGLDIENKEHANSKIKAWKITPHMNGQFTHYLIRSYQEAQVIIGDTMAFFMDDIDPAREKPIAITLEVVEMTLAEYEATQDQ